MGTLDLLILFIVAAGLISGFIRGLIKQLTSLVSILVGITFARLLYWPVAEFLNISAGFSVTMSKPMAFILVWVLISLLCTIAAFFLTRTLQMISLGWVNRWGGSLLGGMKYLLIISLFINLVDAIDSRNHLISAENKANAFLYLPTKDFATFAFPFIKDVTNKAINTIAANSLNN
jgi:Colicin V production protein.